MTSHPSTLYNYLLRTYICNHNVTFYFYFYPFNYVKPLWYHQIAKIFGADQDDRKGRGVHVRNKENPGTWSQITATLSMQDDVTPGSHNLYFFINSKSWNSIPAPMKKRYKFWQITAEPQLGSLVQKLKSVLVSLPVTKGLTLKEVLKSSVWLSLTSTTWFLVNYILPHS